MKKHKFYVRYFRCSECEFKRQATKGSGVTTNAGHEKHMFCPQCNKVTKFIQTE